MLYFTLHKQLLLVQMELFAVGSTVTVHKQLLLIQMELFAVHSTVTHMYVRVICNKYICEIIFTFVPCILILLNFYVFTN